MNENFDDLSDDFLNEGDDINKNTNKRKGRGLRMNGDERIPIDINNLDGLPDDLPPEIRGIIEALGDIKKHGGSVEDELNLGEADETETRDEDGNHYEKKTWETDWGSVTRLSIGGDLPPDMDKDAIRRMFDKKFGKLFGKKKKKELTLEDKLEKALEEEDYLEAAKLRDEIAEKNKKSENSGNEDTEGDSETNFWDNI